MSDADVQNNNSTFMLQSDGASGAEMTDDELKKTLESMSNDEAVETIARGLLYEKGFRDLDKDTENEMVRDLVVRINNAIGEAVVNAIPESERDGLEDLIDNGDRESLQELVEKNDVKLEDVMAKALEKFGSDYLAANVEG